MNSGSTIVRSSTAIEYIAEASAAGVGPQLQGRVPRVFASVARAWPACDSWTAERLTSACGERRIRIEHYPNGDRTGMWTYRELSVADYFTLIQRADEQRRYYLAEKPISQVFPELAAEVRFAELLPPGARTIKEVVFAGSGTFSAPHFHRGAHALVVQLVGRKRLYLVDPSQTRRLDLHPWYSPRNNFTRSGSEQQPIAASIPVTEIQLQPGDALFIPVHWWHWVIGDGMSVTTTVFWKAPYRDWTFPAPGLRDLVAAQVRALQLALGKASVRLGLVGPLAAAAEKLGIVDDRRLLEDFLRNE